MKQSPEEQNTKDQTSAKSSAGESNQPEDSRKRELFIAFEPGNDYGVHTKLFADRPSSPVPAPRQKPSTPPKVGADATGSNTADPFATLPVESSYPELSSELVKLSHQFREQLAKRLQPALNAEMRTRPHATHEEKKELARWVTEELQKFGLAVKCPNTGLPATLVGDKGDYTGGGRFQFLTNSIDGKRKPTASTKDLPTIELVDLDFVYPTERGDWQSVVGPPDSRSPRKR